MSWLVVMTKPNHEMIAAKNLQQQGFCYYLPQIKVRNKPVGPWQIRPVFPRYIFVFLERTWRSLNGTRGVSYVLGDESGPYELPDSEIDRLKAREDKHGIIQLESPPEFTPGQKLKIKDGLLHPLEGRLLVFDGMCAHDRVRVLYEILGRYCPIELEKEPLVAA